MVSKLPVALCSSNFSCGWVWVSCKSEHSIPGDKHTEGVKWVVENLCLINATFRDSKCDLCVNVSLFMFRTPMDRCLGIVLHPVHLDCYAHTDTPRSKSSSKLQLHRHHFCRIVNGSSDVVVDCDKWCGNVLDSVGHSGTSRVRIPVLRVFYVFVFHTCVYVWVYVGWYLGIWWCWVMKH